MENTLTVNALITKYSAWCSKHRAPRSCEWYANYLNNLLSYPGIADLPAPDIRPFHITEWVDSKEGWGGNYKRGAVIAIERVYNWAVQMGYLEKTPIRSVPKPPSKRREIYMKTDDFERILSLISEKDSFRDFFQVMWYTGCRPQELRHIEPRHVDLTNECIVLPAEESKGKKAKRVIYIQGVALEIVRRLMAEGREGKLFTNSRGSAWSKFSICNRFMRFSRILGKRLFAYSMRHGFATRKLIQGHDCITVACLMGHTDGTMVAKVYAHLNDDTVHLKKALMD